MLEKRLRSHILMFIYCNIFPAELQIIDMEYREIPVLKEHKPEMRFHLGGFRDFDYFSLHFKENENAAI